MYRSQSIDLLCKSMDWFLYDNGLRHERVNLICVCFHSGFIIFVSLFAGKVSADTLQKTIDSVQAKYIKFYFVFNHCIIMCNACLHNVVKWLNILQTSCGVQTTKCLKCVRPFFNIIYDFYDVIIYDMFFNVSIF